MKTSPATLFLLLRSKPLQYPLDSLAQQTQMACNFGRFSAEQQWHLAGWGKYKPC
jgi:hypothetical protein